MNSPIKKLGTESKSGLASFLENPDPTLYLKDDYCVCDFETTNRNKGSSLDRTNRIVLATWLGVRGRPTGPIHVSARSGGEFNQASLVATCRSAGFIVAHHSKFELGWLQRCGLEIGSVLVWDTLIAEFIIAGNRRWNLSLENTAERYGLGSKVSFVKVLVESGVCPSVIPEQWLLEYCSQDTLLTHQIFLKQREEIVRLGLLGEMYTACLLTPVLVDIESRGVQLDINRVNEEYGRARLTTEQLDRRLNSFGSINWNSSRQVGELLYRELGFNELKRAGNPNRTEAGRPRTDGPTIERLAARTDRQREFQETFREFKRQSKRLENLEKLKACCDLDAGRLYAQYNQAVAGTHRLSSSGLKHKVQFQNIDHTLKQLFRAREDSWRIAEADGVQLEFRVAAHLGRDPVALDDIRNPSFDVHWQTAEAMHGKSRSDLTKEDRYDAKPSTFRPLYGATSGTPQERKYIEFFQKRYKGIYDTQTAWTYEVLANKKLQTETGLIFYWPDTKLEEGSHGRGYIRNRTAIFNYPVQFLATGVIIPIALIYFWHRAKAEGLRLFVVNTVHDSIIVELPKEEEDDFRRLSRRCFTVDCYNYLNRVYNIDFTVPLGCETKVGEHWSEGNAEKFDLDPEKRSDGGDSLPELRDSRHTRRLG